MKEDKAVFYLTTGLVETTFDKRQAYLVKEDKAVLYLTTGLVETTFDKRQAYLVKEDKAILYNLLQAWQREPLINVKFI